MTRRKFLAGLVAAGAASVASGAGCASRDAVSQGLPTSPTPLPTSPVDLPLGQIARSAGYLFGAAVDFTPITGDSQFAAAVARECAIITSENSLKWAALRPGPDVFDFTRGDALQGFARANGLAFHGHTLVWHNSLPSWVASTVTAKNAEAQLTQHIATVMRHYAGSMHSWDVVNEAVDPGSGRTDGLRDSLWMQALGPRYLDLAFATAAAADPSALLCYNEYGLELTSSGARRDATLRLLSGLRNRGVPIHALGIQGHIGGTSWAQFSPAAFASFLHDVAQLGLRIFITEMDAKDNNLPADIAQRDAVVAQIYRDYLAVALAEPAVEAIITWGLSDRYTWLSTNAPRSDGLVVRPLPLDRDMQRKPAWTALANAFRGVRGAAALDATAQAASGPSAGWSEPVGGTPTGLEATVVPAPGRTRPSVDGRQRNRR